MQQEAMKRQSLQQEIVQEGKWKRKRRREGGRVGGVLRFKYKGQMGHWLASQARAAVATRNSLYAREGARCWATEGLRAISRRRQTQNSNSGRPIARRWGEDDGAELGQFGISDVGFETFTPD